MAAKRTNVATQQVIEDPSLMAIRKALEKLRKNELIDIVVSFAKRDREILRQLLADFQVELPTLDLVADTQKAIVDATAFDTRQINRNFDYDYRAYNTIQRNLKRLVVEKRFDEAMGLSLELMRRGSHQVEMSDEGLMTDDIERCLNVVIEGLTKSKMPSAAIVDWCDAMKDAERVDYICDEELESLHKRFAR